ncbi:MAG: DMT family transporter [Sandaracinaceae bacterium]|nr:DMT family transporter [Sandaracinaceae bacterium]
MCLAITIGLRGVSSGEWPDPPSLASLGWVAATALVSQLVGHTALTWALRHASPTHVALATTAEPVIAALVVFVWLGEEPGALVIAGSLVTLGGVVVGMTRPAAPVEQDTKRP